MAETQSIESKNSQVAILFVHGTARSETARFANFIFESAVAAWITSYFPYGTIYFKAIDYAAPLSSTQQQAFDAMSHSLRARVALRAVPMLEFSVLMRYFSDKAYREKVQLILSRSIKELASNSNSSTKLILISHSLGTVVTTEFISDLRFGKLPKKVYKALGDEGLELLSRLMAVYTLGCPINWFYPTPEACEMEVPLEHSREAASELKWVNFFYPSDIFVAPISKLAPHYAHVEDVAIPMGMNPLKWILTSHFFYPCDKFIFDRVRMDISRILCGQETNMPLQGIPRSRTYDEATISKTASVNCLLQLHFDGFFENNWMVSSYGSPPAVRLGSSKRVVTVLYLHGMTDVHGALNEGKMVGEGLSQCYRRLQEQLGQDAISIAYKTVNYAALAKNSSDAAWKATFEKFPLTCRKAREYVQSHFPVTMFYMTQGTFRRQVHELIDDALKELARCADNPKAPLVVIGYSFGSIVGASYLGNLQRRGPSMAKKGTKFSAIEKGLTLHSFLTIASPLGWFIDPKSIRVPKFFGHRNAHFAGWRNIFYDYDLAAGPLRPLSTRFADAVQEDIPIPNGWNTLRCMLGALNSAYLGDNKTWDVITRSIQSAVGKSIDNKTRTVSFLRNWKPIASVVATIFLWRIAKKRWKNKFAIILLIFGASRIKISHAYSSGCTSQSSSQQQKLNKAPC